MRRTSSTTAIAVAVFVLLPTPVFAQGALTLEIFFSKTSYVLHEPVKVRAVLRNTSSATAQVVEVRYLAECFYLEITSPNGAVSRHRTYLDNIGVSGSNEPLRAGEALLVFMYPSFFFENQGGWMFPTVARYDVRLVYEGGEREHSSLQSGDGLVRSNTVGLTFRAPDSTEQEILEALWAGDNWPSAPETTVHGFADVGALAELLKEYPAHELTKYVRQRYANAISLDEQPQVAIDLLRELQAIDPEFRREEVKILLARNLGALAQYAEATETLEAELDRDPLLRTNYTFMQTYLYQRYPHASDNPVTQWRINRRNGVIRPDDE